MIDSWGTVHLQSPHVVLTSAGGELAEAVSYLRWWRTRRGSFLPPLVEISPWQFLTPAGGERSEERRVGKECV